MKLMVLLALAAATALAGPPLVCHPVDIGPAKSLPWKTTNNWNGSVPDYNLKSLIPDTLSILSPSAAIPLRMETIRRAAIYAARNEAVASQLTSQLLARVADLEAAGKPSANAWFDAGYFVETLRQTTFVYRYDMLSPAERAQWRMRGEQNSLDGKPWVERAIRMGGKGMEVALANILEYREADLKHATKLASTK